MPALPKPHHSCRRRFKRPSNVSTSGPIQTSDIPSLSNPSQVLIAKPQLRLPLELIVDIFNKCEALDRVCLALTCKHLLQVSSLVRIRIPSVAKHRFLPPSTCDDVFSLLSRIAPRDDSGRLERNIGLCCDCLRYRTRQTQYWNNYKDKYLGMGLSPEMWKNVVRRWHDNYNFQCPQCWGEEKLCSRNHLRNH